MSPAGKVDTWRDGFWRDSPLFAPLISWCEQLPRGCWPTNAEWNALFNATEIRNRLGLPVTLVPQAGPSTDWREGYEPRAYLKGEVQTRDANWHDLFNALCWLAFPRTKAAINARHHAEFEMRASRSPTRTRQQDALTLLDESGVLVACADPCLARLLRDHCWHELFWQNRRRVEDEMDFVILGHSLYEKSLAPYIGLTGKALLLEVGKDYFGLPPLERLRWLDEATTSRLDTLTTAELAPLPLLGVPGWWQGNRQEDFYGNTRYFRPIKPDQPISPP